MRILGIVLLSLLGLIVLLLLLVLFVPFRVYAGYWRKETAVRIKFLFFRYTLLPQKKKRKKKKKKKKKKQEESEEAEETGKKKKEKKKLDVGLILKLLKKHLPPLLRPFRIRSVNVTWYVHARDAAETAVLYGAASAMTGGILAIFQKFARRFEKARVDLYPDYDGDQGGFGGDVTVSFTVFPLLVAAIRAVIDLYKYKIL